MKLFTHKDKTVLVSTDGEIFFNNKKLKQYDNGSGYKTVSIKSKLFYVHRVVCTAYFGEPPASNLQVNHKNGKRSDNRPENLEWVSCSENHKHAFNELGRIPSKPQSFYTGANHKHSKPVNQIDIKTREVIKTFVSIKEAADFHKVDPTAIYNSITKRGRAKYCRGFDWEHNLSAVTFKPKNIYYEENGVKKYKRNTI